MSPGSVPWPLVGPACRPGGGPRRAVGYLERKENFSIFEDLARSEDHMRQLCGGERCTPTATVAFVGMSDWLVQEL